MQEFLCSEDGAVTVDWVVLAAAVVGLGVATVGAVRSGVTALGSDVSTSLSSASVVSLGTLGGSGAVIPDGVPVSLAEPDPVVDPVPSGPLPPPDL